MSSEQRLSYTTRSIDNEGKHVELKVDPGCNLGDLTPVYENDNCVSLGSFGSPEEYAFLAQTLGCDLVWWSASGRERNSVIYRSDGKQIDGDIDYFEKTTRPTIHVAWSTILQDHVDAFVPKVPIRWDRPVFIREFLNDQKKNEEGKKEVERVG